jgi:hypothetical protein
VAHGIAERGVEEMGERDVWDAHGCLLLEGPALVERDAPGLTLPGIQVLSDLEDRTTRLTHRNTITVAALR